MLPVHKTTLISVAFAMIFVSLAVGAILIGNNQGTIVITFTMSPAASTTARVELATTPTQWQQGLMNRTSLAEHTGMLFMFDNEAPRSFWMKNTLIPLDMLFLDSQRHLIAVHKNAQPCVADPCITYPSNYPARYVIELPAGFVDKYGITKTTSISF